jgi:hypothetical protein
LSEFLEDFPTVTREQAVAALEQAKKRSSPVRVLLDECLRDASNATWSAMT